MKIITTIFLLGITHLSFGQYEIKTLNRPDGVTLKYFNPMQVAASHDYEAGLSLYKSTNNNTYLLAITVLFKTKIPKELNGNLIIQTTGNNGISLQPVMNKIININGMDVATSMYNISTKNISDLKSKNIKLVSFNVDDNVIALHLNKNNDVLIREFSILNNSKDNVSNKKNPTRKSFSEVSDSLDKTLSKSNSLAKQYSNNVYYNTGFGESKYDKDINWGSDIDKNDVRGSIERFRAKARQEEINSYLSWLLGLLFVGIVIYLIFRMINKNISEEIKVNNLSNDKNTIAETINSNNVDDNKLTISTLLYQFCFFKETAQILLGQNENRMEVAAKLTMSLAEEESFLIVLFKSYLKAKSDIELIKTSVLRYTYGSYTFKLKVDRDYLSHEDNDNTYFEILTNDIEKVQSEDGLDLAIANNLIVYVKDSYPKSIFVVVNDPYINNYAIREVFESGISTAITFFEDNEYETISDFLTLHISKK